MFGGFKVKPDKAVIWAFIKPLKMPIFGMIFLKISIKITATCLQNQK